MEMPSHLFATCCALLAGAAFVARPDAPRPHVASPHVASPRTPSSLIFNLDGVAKAERKTRHVMFQVPAGKRLILTDVSLVQERFHGVTGPDLLEVAGKDSTVKLSAEHIAERGAYDRKEFGSSSRPFRVATGLVFGPRSKVVLQFRTSSGRWHYNLNGYFE